MSDRMNTRLLMTGSAIFMGMLALAVLFFPGKILTYFSVPFNGISVLSIKITGAIYAGFALLNWLARGNIIGGIYSRPVAAGNFVHFLIVAILLTKQAVGMPQAGLFWTAAAANAFFAAAFCYVLFSGGKK